MVQNIFTSLFNSHLFDFHEGWMYVLGVGVAGGMVLKTSAREAAEPGNSGHVMTARMRRRMSYQQPATAYPDIDCYRSAK